MANIKPVRLDFKTVEPAKINDKNPIILLHGLSATYEEFDDIATALSNQTGRKLYMLNARNHGHSERSDVFNFDAMAVDVISFMDLHKIKTASVYGHSMGGRLASVLALTYPDRVDNIIVEDMTPKAVPSDLMSGYLVMMKLLSEHVKLIPANTDLKTATEIVLKNFLKNKPKEILQNMKMDLNKHFADGVEQKDGKYVLKSNIDVIIKEFANLKFTENLEGRYNKPALFLYGDLSEFKVGEDKDFILKLFPKAQLHGLPTSHCVHSEAPVEFVKAVEKFLE